MDEDVFRGSNILITGISGFLGGHLARALASRGAHVVGLVRDQIAGFDAADADIVHGRLEDLLLLSRIVKEYEIDFCFHLAAQCIVSMWEDNPTELFRSNVEGTWNVLEACRQSSRIRAVVVASSDKVYGNSIRPSEEGDPLNGAHCYDTSKICVEMLARCYARSYSLPVGVTRCANLYGPGDRNFSRLIPGSIRSLLRGEAPVIRGDGKHRRDYLYVEEAVEGYLLLAEHLARGRCAGEAFNFGTGKRYSVLEVLEILEALLPGRPPRQIRGAKLPHEITGQSLSPKKARQILGWRRRLSLVQGLERSVEWYERVYADGNPGGTDARGVGGGRAL